MIKEYLTISSFGAVLLLIVFAVAYILLDKVLFRGIDFIAELKKQNMAVAVFLGACIIALALIIRSNA